MTALAFITTLRHPHNSNDYREVERIFSQSAASWLRQSHPDIALVVVANRRPPLPDDPRVHYAEVDFAPPSDVNGPRTGIAAVLRDKGTKNAIGVAVARALHARHVMFVDADDFISRRLSAFVAENPEAPGWTITQGWRVNVERRTARRQGDFHLNCGSSHIIRTDLLPAIPGGAAATQDELYTSLGEDVERIFGSHMHLHDDFPLAPLPFPGAMYRVGTSESHSGNALGGWGRPITARLAREFTVSATGRNPTRIAVAVLPSFRAIRDRLRR